MNRCLNIEQAVILCGGLGTRLMPLTEHTPKPMVLVNGRPFLHYLLGQLAENGIKNFLLLTGFLSNQIIQYFGDGTQFGWAIEYSVGPKEWDTGRRLWEAKSKINDEFLLMYSDNFSEINFEKLFAAAYEDSSTLTLSLAYKENGNIKLGSDEHLEDYDNSRPGAGYEYVEIGYMIARKETLFEKFPSTLGHPNFNFSVLLRRLVKERLVKGVVSGGGYHSISDVDRLKLTEQYLKPKKILLIDRDGTINKKAAPGQYITCWEDFYWIENSYEAIKKLSEYGFKFIVITNQAGVDRGMIEAKELNRIHRNMKGKFAEDGIDILDIYCCTDHWEKDSPRRKPMPGMFYEASKKYSIQLSRALYIGDDERDCQAAINANCGMVYLSENVDEVSSVGKDGNVKLPFIKTNNLINQVDLINKLYLEWGCN